MRKVNQMSSKRFRLASFSVVVPFTIKNNVFVVNLNTSWNYDYCQQYNVQ